MKYKIVVIGIMILLLGACGDISYEPVTINSETDTCDMCSMGIQDKQSSAQIIEKDGTPKKFDDIGCLVTFMQENIEEQAEAYVRDHRSNEWVNMETSYFIQSNDIVSPMSYGIIAFTTEKDAKEWYQEHGGDIYSKDELLSEDMKDLKMGTAETHIH